MKRSYEDREKFGEKIYRKSKQKARSKKFIKDGGHRRTHVMGNSEIDIEALEEMFEDQ